MFKTVFLFSQTSAARETLTRSVPHTGARKSALKSSSKPASQGKEQSIEITEVPVKQMNTPSGTQISVMGA